MAEFETNTALLDPVAIRGRGKESASAARQPIGRSGADDRKPRHVDLSPTVLSDSLQTPQRSRCLLTHSLSKLESQRFLTHPRNTLQPTDDGSDHQSKARSEESVQENQPLRASQTYDQDENRKPVPRPTSDRRAFPRRDSSCIVSVCRSEVQFEPADSVNVKPKVHNDHAARAQLELQKRVWQLHSSPLNGPLVDLSMNGVAFLLHEEFEGGVCLLIRLKNRQLHKHIDAVARVVRSIPQDDGQWRIVCSLLKNLSLEQVHEFSKRQFESDFV